MKRSRDLGASLGFLAGTTFGSGIAFLFLFQPLQLMVSVGLCGVAGAIAGIIAVNFRGQRQQQ